MEGDNEMTEFIETTGRSEAAAIETALKQLGLERDEVSIQVVHRAKTGFMGFGSKLAKVRVSYEKEEIPEESTKIEEKEPFVQVEIKTEVETVSETKVHTPEPTVEKEDSSDTIIEETEKKDLEPVDSLETFTEQAEEKEVPEAEAVQPVQAPIFSVPIVEEQGAETPKTNKTNKKKGKQYGSGSISLSEQEDIQVETLRFLEGLLKHLQVVAVPEVSFPGGDVVAVKLEGENLAVLIGRRGETLDAIQQITGYVVQKSCKKRVRIFLDAENYREKREETLIKLAEKMAGQAVKNRRNVPMESMNAYERHIIHEALSDFPKVYTYSTGSDPNRRIVVAYQGANNQSNQNKPPQNKKTKRPNKKSYQQDFTTQKSEKPTSE